MPTMTTVVTGLDLGLATLVVTGLDLVLATLVVTGLDLVLATLVIARLDLVLATLVVTGLDLGLGTLVVTGLDVRAPVVARFRVPRRGGLGRGRCRLGAGRCLARVVARLGVAAPVVGGLDVRGLGCG